MENKFLDHFRHYKWFYLGLILLVIISLFIVANLTSMQNEPLAGNVRALFNSTAMQ